MYVCLMNVCMCASVMYGSVLYVSMYSKFRRKYTIILFQSSSYLEPEKVAKPT